MARRNTWDWASVVPLIHPVKVAIIEAMLWVGEPMSAVDVERMHETSPGLTTVSYHLRNLAVDFSILDLYREELVGAAWKRLYFLRDFALASERETHAA